MKRSLHFVLFICLFSFSSYAQDASITGLTIQDSTVIANMPEWVKPILEKSAQVKTHKIISSYNPLYFEADFTGDKLIDIAFFVENTVDHTKGVMIVNSGKNLVYIVGCGNPTEMGSSFTNFPSWFIFRGKTIFNQSKKKVSITNPAIQLKGTKETNLIIYWSKTKYKTFIQQ